MTALALFAISLGRYVTHWNGPATGTSLGLALTSAGVLCTLAAGFLGWMLVQDYHIGIRLTPTQELDELEVQNVHRIGTHKRHAA